MQENGFSYEALPDEQIVELSAEGDKLATECILERYKNLVRVRAADYFLVGADTDDLIQEGMIGLFKAIRDFDVTKQASFRSFAELCIKRQLITAIKTATRKKHMPLNFYVSLDQTIRQDEHKEQTLADLLIKRDAKDPESLLLEREMVQALEEEIAHKLSALEKDVLSLHMGGLDYREIAKVLGRSPKSIDNALQRIKRKLSETN